MSKAKSEYSFTELTKHKRDRKQLIPPLNQLPLSNNNSWIDHRLPEMLWAILLLNLKNREDWLNIFRKIGKFVENKEDYYDITFFGINQLELTKKESFIKFLSEISDETSELVACVLYIKSLPNYDLWSKYFKKYYKDDKFSLSNLANGVGMTFDHQSQEATDVRWLKVLCTVVTGKMRFHEDMSDTVEGILQYPNYDDQRKVRPTIRAMEVGDFMSKNTYGFSKDFWNQVSNTQCFPSELVTKKIEKLQNELGKYSSKERKVVIENCKKIRDSLFEHYFSQIKGERIDFKLESIFGINYYALSLFTELAFNTNLFSLSSRITIRVLVELLITLKYGIVKEKEDSQVWQDYMSYGMAQAKVTWQKLEENQFDVSMIDKEKQYSIANQDKWMEFVTVNLGHWDNTDLRKMSEKTGLKNFYDKYYSYTSSFVHGHYNAISDSVMQTCVNPLHRFHKIPQYNMPIMPSVFEDASSLILEILKLYKEVYPNFGTSINLDKFNFNK